MLDAPPPPDTCPDTGTVRDDVLETSLWKLSAGFLLSFLLAVLETGWLAQEPQFPTTVR